MKFRKLGKTDLMVSEIGFGCTYFRAIEEGELNRLMTTGMAAGMNLLDVCISEPEGRDKIGKAIAGRRDKLIIQGHLGLAFVDGQYTRTTDLDKSRLHLDDLLTRLNTDYIDIAMLHCIDTPEDYHKAQESGLIDYMLEQKAKGVFKHLGFSSHDTETATEMVLSGHFQVVMFSISPLFDLVFNDMERFFTMPNDEAYPKELSIDARRADFYALCEEKGIGITVMKALAAGSLVDPTDTPFNSAMTVPQCVHYALNRPAVGSVLIGLKNEAQLKDALAYVTATPEELDYSHILNSVTGNPEVKCLYCNHCLPCVSRIDIGATTRILDSATSRGINDTLREEYSKLQAKASSCTQCGLCAARCPFGIDVVGNMKKTAALFEV